VKAVMILTLSVDHRVIDGALAAKFMKKLKEMLENPYGLLV
jgi:pyruvate dehydrogenase E2 component (dihydrolipoamide acetyltransferase)